LDVRGQVFGGVEFEGAAAQGEDLGVSHGECGCCEGGERRGEGFRLDKEGGGVRKSLWCGVNTVHESGCGTFSILRRGLGTGRASVNDGFLWLLSQHMKSFNKCIIKYASLIYFGDIYFRTTTLLSPSATMISNWTSPYPHI
jgi:hypothetical protein